MFRILIDLLLVAMRSPLLSWNHQRVSRLLGHLQKISRATPLHSINRISRSPLVHTEAAVNPGQQAIFATNLEQRADERLRRWVFFLFNSRILYGIGMWRLIFQWQAYRSLVCKHVDSNTLLQSR